MPEKNNSTPQALADVEPNNDRAFVAVPTRKTPNQSVRPEPDGTTSHSTKPASGQVAGYVEGRTSQADDLRDVSVHGSTSCACAVGASALYSHGLPLAGAPRTEDFSSISTSLNVALPRTARLPINRCNLPADILGGLTFQRSPVALELDGVAQFHRGLFALLDKIDDAKERADAFTLHMSAAFYLDEPEQAGYTPQSAHKRHKADYLRMMRGWSFDADSREGAALKGWVESRFGLLPRHHAGPIRDLSGNAYRHYLEMRATALYGTNALEAQFDLLYSYCQYELARRHMGKTHLTLYRGVNRVDDFETLAALDDRHRVVLFNSLNSFTASLDRAGEFGDSLLTVHVPLAKVFCYTRLLPGMLQGEDEYTVIGGLYEVSIAAY